MVENLGSMISVLIRVLVIDGKARVCVVINFTPPRHFFTIKNLEKEINNF